MTIQLLLASIESDEQRNFAEKIYLEHCQLMMSIAYNILENHDEAEDVMMTMMLKFTDNIEYFMQCEPKGLTALIVVCTRNAAIDEYRKKKVRAKKEMRLGTFDDEGEEISGDVKDPDDYLSVETLVLSSEGVDIIKKAMKRLKRIDKDILMLRTIHHFPSKVAAEMLGISVNAVDLRLKKARARLKKILLEMRNETNE